MEPLKHKAPLLSLVHKEFMTGHVEKKFSAPFTSMTLDQAHAFNSQVAKVDYQAEP